MSGGTKHDTDKVRFDLLSYPFLEGIAAVLTFGAAKYDAHNWRKGIAYSRLFAALMRHLWVWWWGDDRDPETGRSHLDHAGCCLMFLRELSETRPDLDDRWKGHTDDPPVTDYPDRPDPGFNGC